MNRRGLAVVTTELPPATCGIGTYSWLLRKHWPNESSQVRFFVRDNATGEKTTPLGDPILRFAAEKIGDDDVLLHYAGRAYHRFGFPFAMSRAFAKWKRKHPNARFAVFVHEVAGEFPVTSHHYWFGKLSESVLRRLSATADLLMTNTEHHREKLRRISRRDNIHVLPVGSNIEPLASPERRAPGEFIIFGLPFGRLQTLRFFDHHIARWIGNGSLTKLHLVGPRDEQFAPQADEIVRAWKRPDAVVEHGALASPALSPLLRRVQFALTNVSEETWSKSGVFLACAAHECPIVIASTRAESGPFASTLGADEIGRIASTEIERRTSALFDWYRAEADWPRIAQRMQAIWQS